MDASTARRIRFLRATQGLSSRTLADMFSLSPETVRRCLRWETWRGLAEEGPGATHEEWAAAPKPSATDVQASMQRLQGLMEGEGQPVPSLEEALKAVPAEQAPALGKLLADVAAQNRLSKELDELAGHSSVAVVGSSNTATSTQSTDGGTK